MAIKVCTVILKTFDEVKAMSNTKVVDGQLLNDLQDGVALGEARMLGQVMDAYVDENGNYDFIKHGVTYSEDLDDAIYYIEDFDWLVKEVL